MIAPPDETDPSVSRHRGGLPLRFGLAVFGLYLLYEFVVEIYIEGYFLLDHVEHFSEKIETVAAVGLILFLAGIMASRIEREKERIYARLAASEERISQITHATQDAIVMIDDRFRIDFWSGSASRLFGITDEQAMGASAVDLLVAPSERQAVHEWLLSLRHGGEALPVGSVFPITALRKGRRPFAAEVTVRSLLIGDRWHLVAVVRNVTRQRRAQRKLERAHRKAEEAVAEKEKYVSLIAHDLKGPFSAMVTLLALFEEELAEHPENPLNSRFRHPVKQLIQSSRSALKMVDKVLLAHRIKQGGLPVERRRFSASAQADEAIALHRQMAALKGVELLNEIPTASLLYGDPTLFLEVLNNLVANAIKFCRANDRITLTLPPDGNGVAVTDTGVGIDEEKIHRAMAGESSYTTTGAGGERGHGLGLPLAARIMAANDGSLTAQRRPEGGSVFYAHLPKPAPCALVACRSEESICIAHDALQELGVEVRRFAESDPALTFLKEGLPDLVISGALPPRGSGFDETLTDACKELRRAEVPIIVCNKRVREGCQRRTASGERSSEISDGLRKRIQKHLL